MCSVDGASVDAVVWNTGELRLWFFIGAAKIKEIIEYLVINLMIFSGGSVELLKQQVMGIENFKNGSSVSEFLKFFLTFFKDSLKLFIVFIVARWSKPTA